MNEYLTDLKSFYLFFSIFTLILSFFFIIIPVLSKVQKKQKHPMNLLIRRLKVTSLAPLKNRQLNPLRYLFIFSLKQVQRFPTDLNQGNKRDHVLQDVINTGFHQSAAQEYAETAFPQFSHNKVILDLFC